MATYYVSNAASGGYALGSDSNAGTDPSVPFLTISKGLLTGADGDTTVVNKSGIAYDENTGGSNNGLQIPQHNNFSTTLMGDPAQVGVVTIRAAASDRVINLRPSTKQVTMNDIDIDCQNLAQFGIQPNNQSGGFFTNNLHVRNCPVSRDAIGAFSGSGNVVSMVKSGFKSSCVNGWLGGGSFTSISILGCDFACSTTDFLTWLVDSGTIAFLTVGVATDGTRTTFNGSAGTVMSMRNGTVTACDWSGTDFSGGKTFGVISDTSGTAPSTLTSWKMHGNTVSGSSWTHSMFEARNVTSSLIEIYNNQLINTGGAICSVNSENCTNTLVHDNGGSVAASSTQDPVKVVMGTVNIAVYNNVITNNSTTAIHTFLVGQDGYNPDLSNITATTTQNLGDVSGNAYVDQAFKTSTLLSVNGRGSQIGAAVFTMKSQGNPTGNVAFSIYTDSAGVPGTKVEDSETTVACSTLTGSNQTFLYLFTAHNTFTPGMTYHYVAHFTGTVDGTNYVVLAANSTVTNGNLAKSATGPGGSWVADGSHAILWTTFTGIYNATVAVYGNTHIAPKTANSQVHAFEVGSTNAGVMYQNMAFNFGPGVIFKDCTGGTAYDNLLYTSIGNQSPLFFKACTNGIAYQNTAISNSGAGGATVFAETDSTVATGNPPVSSVTVYNNILANINSGDVFTRDAGCTLVSDYNVVYNAGAANVDATHTTWAGWQGAGFDTHSVNANPLLSNISSPSGFGDFVPSVSSVALGLGKNLAGAVTSDYAGNLFKIIPDAGGYSISAYYLAAAANKIVYNVFTNRFDYEGLTKVGADPLYAGVPVVGSVTASASMPPSTGTGTVFANATSGAVTVTLPSAAGTNQGVVIVRKNDSSANAVTVATTGGQTINGASTAVLSSQHDSIILSPTGTNWGGSVVPNLFAKVLFNHFSDVGNTTTSETDLYSDSIPAGQLSANGNKLAASYGGVFVSSGTATRQVRFYFGGTLILDTGALTVSLSSSWAVQCAVIRDSSTSVRAVVSLQTEGAALAAYTATTKVSGLTLSNANILKVTGQAGGVGAATNDIVAQIGYVQFIP